MNELQQLHDEITQLNTALTIKNGTIDRLKEQVGALEAKYQRDVYGLNNEGDPIGGEPAGGYANDNARLKARVAELEAELAKLLAGQESLLLNLADQKRQAVEYREMWAKASERAYSQSSALYARQVPEGWRVERRELDGSVCFIIGSPRIVGVRSNTSVWESDSDPAHLLLWHLLAASTGQEVE